MRREYGRAPRGQRVGGRRPGRMWRNVSLIGAVRIGKKPKLMTHRGSVDGKVFLRFVRRRLVPWLRPGDVVVMDNLLFHKMKAVQAAIRGAGALPLYLPTYSPELNPIERWWADLKRALRSLGIDTEEHLLRAVRGLRAKTPVAKILAWFRNALAEARIN